MILIKTILLSSLSFAGFNVTLDPGHGGNDVGAQSKPIVEKKIVLEVARKIKISLEKKDPSIQVQLTREKDETISLEQRVEKAHQYKSDLYVSLHANWSNSPQVSGFEFYFGAPSSYTIRKPQAPLVSDSKQIVQNILQDLKSFTKQKQSLEFSSLSQKKIVDRKSVIRKAPFYVIEQTHMPAVLVEIGFISNRREARKLADPEYQNQIAEMMADSIIEFKEKSDKRASVTDNSVHE